jgi:hypothetical protein
VNGNPVTILASGEDARTKMATLCRNDSVT